MAQQCAISAAEHSRKAAPLLRQPLVSYRVNALANPMKPPCFPSAPEPLLGIPKPLELPHRHHAMLPFRQLRQRMVTSSFYVHLDY